MSIFFTLNILVVGRLRFGRKNYCYLPRTNSLFFSELYPLTHTSEGLLYCQALISFLKEGKRQKNYLGKMTLSHSRASSSIGPQGSYRDRRSRQKSEKDRGKGTAENSNLMISSLCRKTGSRLSDEGISGS